MNLKSIFSSIAIAASLSGGVGVAQAVTVTEAGVQSHILPQAYFQVTTTPSGNVELVSTSTGPTHFILESASPASNVQYALYLDTDAALNSVSFDNSAALFGPETSPLSSANPDYFFEFIVQQGQQYVLSIVNLTQGATQTITSISSVPLPGAIWLFASALLGFFGFSSRRKA